jgi:hypothetical protein
MNDFVLIVEGEEDYNFLLQVINREFKKVLERNDFIIVEGKTETLHIVKKEIETAILKGKRTIFIFDADDDNFESTKSKIDKECKKLELSINNIFLFPDNSSKGNLETLLISIVPESNRKLLDCVDNYVACGASTGIERLRHIDNKEKLYIYHGSFKDSKKAKGTERSYSDPTIWNLDSDKLQPLIKFLRPLIGGK